jgi:ABC-type phosphate transport system auxiliary subunit
MDESKTDEMKLVRQISSMFKEKGKAQTQSAEEKPAQRIYLQIKKLENEHKSKIDANLSRIHNLRQNQEKLKIALDILRELDLSIPAEYNARLNSYPQEINALESEIDREKIFLNYLQSRVLPLIEK